MGRASSRLACPARGRCPSAAYVLVGSRGESRERAGLAHFMEHITFKGTRDLTTSREVSESIEGVGGTFNASTDRESTVYWVRLPVREAERAFHVLADLTLRPLLRSDDIARERDIIVEEIRSYRDDPGQFVFNIWDEAYFGDTPLGWEIAGDEETVAGLSDTDVRDFWAAGYRPSNLVVAVAGDIGHDDAVELRRPVLRPWRRRRARLAARADASRRSASGSSIATPPQAHVCLGLAGPAARPRGPVGARAAEHDPRRGHVLAALPQGPRGGRARLRRALVPDRLRRLRPAPGLSRRRPR